MNFHGGQCPNNILLDFSVNIPRLPYSEKLKETWIQSMEKLYDYPEIEGKTAREALGRHLDISDNQIILGNGATDLIYLIARAFSFKHAMILEPTFTEYRRALNLQRSSVVSFAYKEVDRHGRHYFEVDPRELAKEINTQKCDSLFVCNPNNPTGQLLDAMFFKVLRAHIDHPNFMIIIDESFIDFRDQSTYLSEMKRLSNEMQIIQLRSMTKTYGVPGLRIGYLVSNERVTNTIASFREPWTLNRFALESIPVLVADDDHLKETRRWCLEAYEDLKSKLETVSIFKVFESHANFILVKLLNGDPEMFHQALIASGIYLRTCYDFEGLGANYFRIALRQNNDHNVLIKNIGRF